MKLNGFAITLASTTLALAPFFVQASEVCVIDDFGITGVVQKEIDGKQTKVMQQITHKGGLMQTHLLESNGCPKQAVCEGGLVTKWTYHVIDECAKDANNEVIMPCGIFMHYDCVNNPNGVQKSVAGDEVPRCCKYVGQDKAV